MVDMEPASDVYPSEKWWIWSPQVMFIQVKNGGYGANKVYDRILARD
jgi:hypothetical protein